MKIDRSTLSQSGIPEYMHDGIILFYEKGIPPGGFLTAVINNDLRGACERADDINRHRLFNYMTWFYNHAPSGTWGFATAVDDYLDEYHGETE